MSARLARLAVVVVASVFGGCGKSKPKSDAPPPEVTGLAAVPATAEVVIAADVAKLAESAIVARAAEQLLLREPSLAEGWAGLRDHCKVDVTAQIKHVALALGPPPASAGSGPVLMVATGSVAEADLVACVPKIVGTGGGGLTSKQVAGRTVYQVKDGNRIVFFAFGRKDTVVLSTSEPWLTEALGAGKKLHDNPTFVGWLERVDQRAPLWAAGRVDARVGQGLVAASGGKLQTPPEAIVASLDPRDGAKLDLGVLMPSAEVAKALESFAKTELAVIAMAAQLKSLGQLVSKLSIAADGSIVRFRATLTQAEVNQLLSVLDEKPAPEQGSPPPPQ